MMAYPSDKMADFPSFSKWKWDASHLTPSHLTLNNNWAGGSDHSPSDKASSPWRVARQEIWQQNCPGFCTATLLPDNKSGYRKMDLFWRRGISLCFSTIVWSHDANQAGEQPFRNYFVKLKCSETGLVKLAKLEMSKHRGICCRLGGAILQEVISTVIFSKRWQNMAISTNIARSCRG